MDYPTLLSLNRFENKKNLALAVETFSAVRKTLAAEGLNKFDKPLRLVIGGTAVFRNYLATVRSFILHSFLIHQVASMVGLPTT